MGSRGFSNSPTVPGYGGGFGLPPCGTDVSLLQVYEAIEGPLMPDECLLETPVCGGGKCIFGDLLTRLNEEVWRCLSETQFLQLTRAFRG